MKTLTVKMEYTGSDAQEQLQMALEGTDFKLLALDEANQNSTGHTDSSYEKMHNSLPNQPEGAAPDVSSSGAGGMVSPDSDAYPNKK
ncbi:hypothetical protein JOC78_002513 [Bacillus ectoiniformans]|uniref:hypothetical protein n=1 Tax=Bacillus ectoiniformans TaxID=1494429 RepID=UPI001958D7F2|nr:hypothetical protein [Bacillus ectoiniformans]MBM7649539.1 hypothetical protein [Bacillus ectoiniformans]